MTDLGSVVAVVLDEGDIVDVALVCGTNPNHFGGVRQLRAETVDAEEDEGGVEKVFHEDDAHLLLAKIVKVGLFLALSDGFFHCFCEFIVVCGCPVFCDGGHETVWVAVVMIVGIMILRRPDNNFFIARDELKVSAFGGSDAEEWKEVVVRSERLALVKDAWVVCRRDGCRGAG